MRARGRREGMTLVEVLVAVTIMAMLGVAIATAFSQTSQNKRRIEDEADRYHVLRMAMDRMTREVSMAYVSAQLNPNSALQAMKTTFVGSDHGHTDRLDFTSFSHQRLYRDAHESDQNEISYFVTRHPDDSRVSVLARRVDSRPDDQPERGGRVEILLEGVESFDLEYLDPQTLEWTSSWDARESQSHANRLPVQVRMTLTIPDPHAPDEELTLVGRANVEVTWALNHATYNP